MIVVVFKFVVYVVGGHGDYWPGAPKGIATPQVSAGAVFMF